jgi:hypothetical protein
LLRAKRDAVAAKVFFKKAIKHNGRPAKGHRRLNLSGLELGWIQKGLDRKEPLSSL